jgi:hypothetical protein
MALLYLLTTGMGVVVILFRRQMAAEEDMPPEVWLAYGLMIIAIGIVCGALYLASFFLPLRRWAWIYHIVLISIGMTSCCCLPVCIPLLIFWIKPEMQAYFDQRVGP